MRNGSPNRRKFRHSQENQFAGYHPSSTSYFDPIPVSPSTAVSNSAASNLELHSQPQPQPQSHYDLNSSIQSRRSSRVPPSANLFSFHQLDPSIHPQSHPFYHSKDQPPLRGEKHDDDDQGLEDQDQDEDEGEEMQRLWRARLRLGVPQRSLTNPYSKRFGSFFNGEYHHLKSIRSPSPPPTSPSSPQDNFESGFGKRRTSGHSSPFSHVGMDNPNPNPNPNYPSSSKLPSPPIDDSSDRPSYSRISSLPLNSTLGLFSKSQKRDLLTGNSNAISTSNCSNSFNACGTVSPLSLDYSPSIGFNHSSRRPSLQGRACTESALDDGLLLATAALKLHEKKLKSQVQVQVQNADGRASERRGSCGKGAKLTVQERRATKAEIGSKDEPLGSTTKNPVTSRRRIDQGSGSIGQDPPLSLSCQRSNSSTTTITTRSNDSSDLVSSTSSLPSLSISSTSTASSAKFLKQTLEIPVTGGGERCSRLKLALKELPKATSNNSREMDLEIQHISKERMNRKAILDWTSGWSEWEWNLED